jgi:fatty acid desaturase
MSYDWDRLQRDEDRRLSRNLRPLATVWIALGFVGAVAAIVTGHWEKLTGLVIWFALGVWMRFATRDRTVKGHDPLSSAPSSSQAVDE